MTNWNDVAYGRQLGQDQTRGEVSAVEASADSQRASLSRQIATLNGFVDGWRQRAETAEDLFENFAKPKIIGLMVQLENQQKEIEALRAHLAKSDAADDRKATHVRHHR